MVGKAQTGSGAESCLCRKKISFRESPFTAGQRLHKQIRFHQGVPQSSNLRSTPFLYAGHLICGRRSEFIVEKYTLAYYGLSKHVLLYHT
jgi:hypothetical protein